MVQKTNKRKQETDWVHGWKRMKIQVQTKWSRRGFTDIKSQIEEIKREIKDVREQEANNEMSCGKRGKTTRNEKER